MDQTLQSLLKGGIGVLLDEDEGCGQHSNGELVTLLGLITALREHEKMMIRRRHLG